MQANVMKLHAAGFTLIELIMVVVILVILSLIAVPSYQMHLIRQAESQARQELLKIAEQLERHKSRNFSYHGFDLADIYEGQQPGADTLQIPLNKQSAAKYELKLADVSEPSLKTLLSTDQGIGRQWAMAALPLQAGYEAYLIRSDGKRCKTEYWVANDVKEIQQYQGCGSNEKVW